MIFDNQTLLSDAQAITTDAVSTNVIDLGPASIRRDIGKGCQIPLLVQVVQTFTATGAATLEIKLEGSADEAFTSPVSIWTSGAIGKADLTAGKVIIPEYIPRGTDLRYIRLNYDVETGPMTAGKITAGVTMGNQSNG